MTDSTFKVVASNPAAAKVPPTRGVTEITPTLPLRTSGP